MQTFLSIKITREKEKRKKEEKKTFLGAFVNIATNRKHGPKLLQVQ